MSEMLGNQYFLSRRYCEAIAELEIALAKGPANKSVKKKLIICYVKTCKLDKALELFEQLINEDIFCIINTDPVLDDCPCPEIIYEFECSDIYSDGKGKELALGILWLYCDVGNSILYFQTLSKSNQRFQNILHIIESINHQTMR